MVYWKSSTSATKHGSPFAPVKAATSTSTSTSTGAAAATAAATKKEEDVTYEMTALEIVVLVITFLAFIGQFVNLYFAIVDHQKIKKLTAVQ